MNPEEPAEWIEPMLAKPAATVPVEGEWIFERKLDGLRCVCVRNGNDVQLLSRNKLSFNSRFPEVVRAIRNLGADNCVLDGELVAFDQERRTSFSFLQRGATNVEFHVFDVLHLFGRDTRIIPLMERKALVYQMLSEGDVLQTVPQLTGDPNKLLKDACSQQWEGLIAKRAQSLYKSGRSGDWLKLKCTASQELVIGGWTEPKGARIGFGALLMGYFDGEQFMYAGKVGTGFDGDLLRSLYSSMTSIEQSVSPFANPPRERTVHWVRPELVANVGFTEWTNDGRLRHPTFQGLRPDKAARAVVRES